MGFVEIQQLNVFFRGLDWTYQATLDSASQGNFKTRIHEEATRFIENVVTSTSAKNTDLERRKMAENSNGDRISKVKVTSDLVHAFVIGKEQVKFTDESPSFSSEGDEEDNVDLIDETGFCEKRFADQQRNMSFTKGYQAAPTHEGIVEFIMGKVLKGQQKMSANFDVRLDSMYSNLNEKFEGVSAHLKKLDIQVAHYDGLVRREEGFFPGITDTNPRHPVNVVTLRSGRQLTPHLRNEMEELDRAEGLEDVQTDLDEKEAASLIDERTTQTQNFQTV